MGQITMRQYYVCVRPGTLLPTTISVRRMCRIRYCTACSQATTASRSTTGSRVPRYPSRSGLIFKCQFIYQSTWGSNYRSSVTEGCRETNELLLDGEEDDKPSNIIWKSYMDVMGNWLILRICWTTHGICYQKRMVTDEEVVALIHLAYIRIK